MCYPGAEPRRVGTELNGKRPQRGRFLFCAARFEPGGKLPRWVQCQVRPKLPATRYFVLAKLDTARTGNGTLQTSILPAL